MNRTIRLCLYTALSLTFCLIAPPPAAAAPVRVPVRVPAAPVSAPTIAATANASRVALEWNRIDDAREYHVFRSTSGTFGTTPLARVSGRRFVDWHVVPGRNYSYRVAAVNRGGTGPLSNVASAMPLLPPQGLTATPGNGTATIKWLASAGAVSYVVYRGPSWTPDSLTEVGSGPSLEFVDTGLTNGTRYVYRVRAINGTNHSRLSQAVQVKPKAPPAPAPSVAPQNLTGTLGNSRITLTWSAVPGATGYRIFRSTTDSFTAPPIGSSPNLTFVDLTIKAGVTYRYKVAAFNTTGTGPLSAMVTVAQTPAPAQAPSNLTAAFVDGKVALQWSGVSGVTGYRVFRSLNETFSNTPLGNTAALNYLDGAVTPGTKYFYRVAAYNAAGNGPMSPVVDITPAAAPAAPANLSAVGGSAMITLSWTPVSDAATYNVYRGTAAGAQNATPLATGLTTTAFVDSAVTNGTAYFYKVTAVGPGGQSARSNEASATPLAPIAAPTGVSAAGGDASVTVSWLPVTGALSYSVYRGTSAGGELPTPIATGIMTTSFVDTPVANGVTYFYQVTAVTTSTQSARSAEVSATPSNVPPVAGSTLETFRFLRQATWGPKPGDVAALAPLGAIGRDNFITQQLTAPVSVYPDTLFNQEIEVAQEQFMSLALNGQDQLRQRVAWALHKIWVVSAVEVPDARAIVTYHRLFLNGAFGNYRDLMQQVTLNPAMGRYLNMVNNKSVAKTGFAANENYAREIMQLFTLGLTQLNPDGTPVTPAVPTYTEDDVKALARIFTGWTYGDGNAATVPGNSGGSTNYGVPMEAVNAAANWHDTTAKTFLGESFAAGGTAQAELTRALDIIFNQPSLAPFVSRQLIQQLVTSNPSPAYVQAVAAVFNDNGGGVRGDLAAVVRAILTHPEALATNDPNTTSGKLAEPVLYIASMMRGFNATVTDHPFMTDRAEVMGQRVFYPPSVFSYFAPGFRVRGTDGGSGVPLQGPEFQGLTTVTALERANFVGALLAGEFGSNVTIDYSPFNAKANDAAQLVDFVAETFMGGRISAAHRAAVIAAVNVTPATNPFERTRTALYLILTSAQAQVDR